MTTKSYATSFTKQGVKKQIEIECHIEMELLRLSRLNPTLSREECRDVFLVQLIKTADYLKKHNN